MLYLTTCWKNNFIKRTDVARADKLNYPPRKGLPYGNICGGVYAVSKMGPAAMISGLTIAWNCLKLAWNKPTNLSIVSS